MRLTLRALSKKATLMTTAFVLAVSSVAAVLPFVINQKVEAVNSPAVVYDALPSVSPQRNYPSQAFQATSTSEFGDYIHLAGSNRKLASVTITMSTWAKFSEYSSNPAYNGNTSHWTLPVTLTIYSDQFDASGAPTQQLTKVSRSINVPWRPEGDATCLDMGYGAGYAWKGSDGICYNGLAFNAEFDLTASNLTLPDDIVVSIAFNTQTHGYNPTGSAGPYDSLNVAVPTNQAVTVGTDDSADSVLLNSTWNGAYGDGGSTGIFRKATQWSPNGTVAMQITASAPLTIAACTTTTTVHTTSLSTWSLSETRANGHNQLAANSLHVYTDGNSDTGPRTDGGSGTWNTDKAAGYYPASFELADLGEGFGLDAVAMSGATPPALQLTVDLDGNGTLEGNLVAEPAFYGADTLWLSSNWTGLDLSSAPTTVNGGGTGKGGTVNAWLSAFPNAKVMAIGYSLGSGVYGDYKITKITANCTEYTFGLAAPTNLTPVNNTLTNDPAFANTWSVVEGAGGYEYRTANVLNGSELGPIIYSDSTVTQPGRYSMSGSTVSRQNGGTPEGNYYWQVRAVDGAGGSGPWSVINKVSVDTTAPSVPTNGQPRDGAYKTTNDFYFTWDASTDANPLAYEFQSSASSATNANGSLLGAWNSIANGNSEQNHLVTPQIHSTGAPDGHYYWQVRAIDAAGNKSAWSTVWDMNIDTQKPTAPTLNSPADNAVVKGASVTQSWNASTSSDIDHYVYQSYNDAAATSVRWTENFTGLSKTATNVANATYWWRVKAVDAAGNESDWSPLWKLTIDNNAPIATFIFPTPGPSATSFQVQFSEQVKKAEAENPANYFLNNWPGAGGSGDLAGDATVVYDETTHMATVTFTSAAWYVSPEQQWGVRNIHDLAGNALTETTKYSTPLVAPTVPGTPTLTSPLNSLATTWGWTAATDPTDSTNASGVKGYEYAIVTNGDTPASWSFTSSTTVTVTVPADGSYRLYVRALDNAGNIGDMVYGETTIDTLAPTVIVNAIADSTDTTPTISGTTSELGGDVTIWIDGVKKATVTSDAAGTWSWTPSTALVTGAHTVIVTATDAAGNTSSSDTSSAQPYWRSFMINTVTTPDEQGGGDNGSNENQGGGGDNATDGGTGAGALAANTAGDGTDTDTLDQQTDTSSSIDTDNENSEVSAAGASDSKEADAPAGIFGTLWYLWLIILAAIAGLWWFVAARRRRGNDKN